MAPKIKYPIKDIIDAAFGLVRREGLENLTSRAIAGELKSSTMPLYSCGKSMLEIEEAVIVKCWEVLGEYQNKEMASDVYIGMGLGYVLFAKNEMNLFNCLRDKKHKSLNEKMGAAAFLNSFVLLRGYPLMAGIPDDLLMKIMFQGWIFSHGLADLLTNSQVSILQNLQTDEALKDFFIEATRINTIGIQGVIEANRN